VVALGAAVDDDSDDLIVMNELLFALALFYEDIALLLRWESRSKSKTLLLVCEIVY
jgi:hypothetical protein